MKFIFLFLAASIPSAALAASVTGNLVAGGGVDDMRIVVQGAAGSKVDAYCVGQCGDWFEAEEGSEVFDLKKSMKGKKVVMEYAVEPNRDRIAGPDSKEKLLFVKKVRVLP
jgi:hypothetical protein